MLALMAVSNARLGQRRIRLNIGPLCVNFNAGSAVRIQGIGGHNLENLGNVLSVETWCMNFNEDVPRYLQHFGAETCLNF